MKSKIRKDWDKSFKKYAKEGEDEKLFPDFLDLEAIKLINK